MIVQFDENGKTIITLSDTFANAVPIINFTNGYSNGFNLYNSV